jgi:8-oxo-dGTP pyrophosphatase MutT (NUDIX family)
MPRLVQIRSEIASYDPVVVDEKAVLQQAAVALILHEPPGAHPEVLLIERAVREGDPWSGQMAFPGGRRDAEDPDLVATAVRETFEEVRIDLGKPIGRLDDVQGARGTNRQNLLVAAFVFELGHRVTPRPGPEVQAAVWVPVPHLLDRRFAVTYSFERGSHTGTFPAVRYEGYTVWGLTYRILGHFFEVLGQELPGP